MSTIQPAQAVANVEHWSQYSRELIMMAGLSALLMAVRIYWFFYRKIKKETMIKSKKA